MTNEIDKAKLIEYIAEMAQRPQGHDPQFRRCETLPAHHLRAAADGTNHERNRRNNGNSVFYVITR